MTRASPTRLNACSTGMRAPCPVVDESGLGLDLLLGHGQDDGGRDPVAGRELFGAEGGEHPVLQGIMPPLPGRAGIKRAVLGRGRFADRVQYRQHRLGTDRGQLTRYLG